jgi:hypothetical protein
MYVVPVIYPQYGFESKTTELQNIISPPCTTYNGVGFDTSLVQWTILTCQKYEL